MSHIPGGLWRPSARDLAGLNIRWHFARTGNSLALVNVPASFTVPQDQVLILQRIVADAVPGAAQNCVGWTIRVYDAVGASIMTDLYLAIGLAGRQTLNLSLDDIWLPPQCILLVEAIFDNNAAANTLTMSSIGVLIPRGNFPSA